MKRLALITGILAGFLFGIATPFSKLLLEGLNSFQLAGLLYLGAALAMMPSLFRKNSSLHLLFLPGSRVKTAGIIFFGGFAGPLLLLAGLKTAHASSVSIWLNMELVATAVLGVLLFKDALDRSTWIGVGLTILAGVVTSFGEGASGITSALLITAACLCWAMDNHLTALTDGALPQTVTFVKGLVAGSVNLLIGMMISTQAVEMNSVLPAIVLGIFAYGISIVLYVVSAQNIGATRSQVLFSTAPIWGVLFAYLINGEPFQWVHLVSIVLLALAVVVINRVRHHHEHTHAFTRHIHYHTHSNGHHNHTHEGGSVEEGKGHSHLHTHEPVTHDHAHEPDLHHRHEHRP